MAKIFARIQRPSLRQGLLFGIILGVVEIAYGFFASFVTQAEFQSVLGTVALALFLLFGFLAGQRASKETGKLGSGVMAGLWAGLIGSFIDGIIPLVGTLVNMQSIVASDQLYIKAHPDQFSGLKPTDYTASDVMTTALVALLFSVLFYTLITLIGGALGGMMGRRRALASASDGEYQGTMFEKPDSNQTVEPAE